MQQCAECVRLWRIYAKATGDHIALQNQLRELRESADVLPALEGAAGARERAREAIATHEAAAHGTKTAGTSGS